MEAQVSDPTERSLKLARRIVGPLRYEVDVVIANDVEQKIAHLLDSERRRAVEVGVDVGRWDGEPSLDSVEQYHRDEHVKMALARLEETSDA